MSNHLYLLCLDHTPPISSWRMGDVGNHLSDLPKAQQYIANRELYLQLWERHDFVQLDDSKANTAMYFFADHPNCNIGIRDEYGRHHPAAAGSIVTHNHPITDSPYGGCNAGCVTFPPVTVPSGR